MRPPPSHDGQVSVALGRFGVGLGRVCLSTGCNEAERRHSAQRESHRRTKDKTSHATYVRYTEADEHAERDGVAPINNPDRCAVVRVIIKGLRHQDKFPSNASTFTQ